MYIFEGKILFWIFILISVKQNFYLLIFFIIYCSYCLFSRPDGTIVPLGKSKNTNVKNPSGYTLNYNEFIVYDTKQIKMKYLVKTKFNFKWRENNSMKGAKSYQWTIRMMDSIFPSLWLMILTWSETLTWENEGFKMRLYEQGISVC